MIKRISLIYSDELREWSWTDNDPFRRVIKLVKDDWEVVLSYDALSESKANVSEQALSSLSSF